MLRARSLGGWERMDRICPHRLDALLGPVGSIHPQFKKHGFYAVDRGLCCARDVLSRVVYRSW